MFSLRPTCSRSLKFVAGRRFASSTPPAKAKSSLPLMFAAGGAVMVGGYYLANQSTELEPLPSSMTPSKGSTEPPFSKEEFRTFKLIDKKDYNHNTGTFTFELPEGKTSQIPVAGLVMLQAADPNALKDKDGKPIARPYTPISDTREPGKITFMIKKYPDGNASKYVHEMSLGQEIGIKGPFQKFEYKANQYEEIGMIAGGSGITPMYQVATHALSNPDNKTKFTLLFSNVTEEDILLREDWDALAKKYPDTFKAVYVLDKPSSSWKGPKGYITADLIKQHLPGASADKGDKVKIYVCGPPPQVKAVAGDKDGGKQGEVGGVLKELGYTKDQVFKF